MSLGLDLIGADYGAIVSTIFQAAGGAVDYAKEMQQEQAAAASADSALSAAIAADRAATSAVTKANTSALVAKADPSKASAAKADKAAADSAVAVQDQAGAAVPEEKRADRVKDAQDAVDAATKKAKAATGSAKMVAHAWLAAAKQTLSKAKGNESGGSKKDKKEKDGDGESVGFFSTAIVGPVKIYHALIAIAAAGAAAVAYKKFHK